MKFVDRAGGRAPRDGGARQLPRQKALDAAAMKEPPKQVVPAAAVAERGGGKVVFVVEEGKVRMVPVTLGAALRRRLRAA